jgi:hypothetical protein
MTRDEALQSLQTIQNKGPRILHLLDEKPRTAAAEAEIRSLADQMKIDLQSEYERISPERVQRRMSMFEISVYSPTIEETWKKTGISRLKTDGIINGNWSEVLEAVVYNTSKYLT